MKKRQKVDAGLARAVELNDPAQVTRLIEAGNDPLALDSHGRTLLHTAANAGSLATALFLIDLGIDLNGQDKNGWSALHFAVAAGHEHVTELLTRRGADVNVCDIFGNTPLWRAVFSFKNGMSGAIICHLLQAGSDPDRANGNNVSPRRLANTIASSDVRRFFAEV